MKNNFLINTLLATLLMSSQMLQAATTVNCQVTQEMYYQPMGDESGKEVMTGKKIYQHCDEVFQTQGPCTEWRESRVNMDLPGAYGIGIEEYTDTGSLGEVVAHIGTINQMSAVFNGVRGYCEEGHIQDLSWLEDPAFWASMIMSAVAAGADTPDVSTANTGADAASGVGAVGTVSDGASAIEAVDDVGTVADTVSEYDEFVAMISTGYGGCALTAGISAVGSAVDYISDNDYECDPVDEFCDEDAAIHDPTAVHTLTTSEYNQLVLENPDILNSIEVLDDGSDGSGYVTIRILSPGELVDTETMVDSEEIKQALEEAKELQLKMEMAMTTVQLAACTGGVAVGGDDGSSTAGGSSGGNLGGTGGMLASAVVGMLPFPYNMIGSVVLKLLDTWRPIHSCTKEEDAEAQGQRHVKAYRGKLYNTCHEVQPPKVVEEWVTGGTMREKFEYCCFDSPMSRILMVQIKAQLGKGWTHCTGITLNELAHVQFTKCTTTQKTAGFADGATFQGIEGVDYNMSQSYQYQYQCMDLDELTEYFESQIPVDFSNTTLGEMLNEVPTDYRQ